MTGKTHRLTVIVVLVVSHVQLINLRRTSPASGPDRTRQVVLMTGLLAASGASSAASSPYAIGEANLFSCFGMPQVSQHFYRPVYSAFFEFFVV